MFYVIAENEIGNKDFRGRESLFFWAIVVAFLPKAQKSLIGKEFFKKIKFLFQMALDIHLGFF